MSSMVHKSSSSSSTDAPNSQGDSYDPEETPLTQLLSVSTTILAQALDLVENVLTSDEQLTIHSKYLPGSTIGKHLRHARDHFLLLLDSVSSPPPHELSYDIRLRNTPMESKLTDARTALKEIISKLEEVVPRAKLDEPMTLHAITPHAQILQTSFGRELWFAGLHAVHHWSMVRVIAGELNIKLQDDFGFAPSTLLYHGTGTPAGKAKI